MKNKLSILLIIIFLVLVSLILFNSKIRNDKEHYIAKNDKLYDIAIDYVKNEDIKEDNPDKNKDNYHFFVDYDKFGITKKGKYKYAYMWILGEAYYLDNGKQKISHGYSMFFKFTFENDKVIKYELPKDGTEYLDSIKKMCIDKKMYNKIINYMPSLSNDKNIESYYFKIKKFPKIGR